MKRLSCVLWVFAACSSGSKSGSQTMPAAAADGPTCTEASDHTIDLLSKGAPDAPPDLVKKIRDTLASHCEKDQWSAASRKCFATLATKDDAQKCEDSLSAAQRESLDKENVGGGDGAGAPAENSVPTSAPPPPGSSRSPTTKGGTKKGGDPEDGGD